jgi:Short C-terminal domain
MKNKISLNSKLVLSALSLGYALSVSSPAIAADGAMDFLFKSGAPAASESARSANQRVWKVGEFSAIRLVQREVGSQANAHPLAVDAVTLERVLTDIQFNPEKGKPRRLFEKSELSDLAEILSDVFKKASSTDDVILLSSARREAGFLMSPESITARLFITDGALNFIVRDVRAPVPASFRATGLIPQLQFGSRDATSTVSLLTATGVNKRNDWISLPLTAASMPAAVSPTMSKDENAADEPTRRLNTIKRLFDQGLITKEEYQERRKSIIQAL